MVSFNQNKRESFEQVLNFPKKEPNYASFSASEAFLDYFDHAKKEEQETFQQNLESFLSNYLSNYLLEQVTTYPMKHSSDDAKNEEAYHALDELTFYCSCFFKNPEPVLMKFAKPINQSKTSLQSLFSSCISRYIKSLENEESLDKMKVYQKMLIQKDDMRLERLKDKYKHCDLPQLLQAYSIWSNGSTYNPQNIAEDRLQEMSELYARCFLGFTKENWTRTLTENAIKRKKTKDSLKQAIDKMGQRFRSTSSKPKKEKNTVEKKTSPTPSVRSSNLLEEFLDPKYQSIDSFCQEKGITKETFQLMVYDLNQEALKEKIQKKKEFLRAQQKQSFRVMAHVVLQSLENGIEDGTEIRSFDMLDYFVITKMYPMEFLNYAMKYCSSKDVAKIRHFFAINDLGSHISEKQELEGTLILHASTNPYEVTKEEKKAAIAFLEENQVPLNAKCYRLALNRKLAGNLSTNCYQKLLKKR